MMKSLREQPPNTPVVMFPTLVLALLVLVAPLIACGGSSGRHGSGNSGSDPPAVSTPYASHRMYRLYDIWFDTASQYNRVFFEQAKQKIADWIDAACGIPNSEGFDVNINFITANSFAPSTRSFTMHCDAVELPPKYPTLTPTPPPDPKNPYDQSAQDAIDAANSISIATYNNQMAAFRKSITNAKKEAKQGTDHLRGIEPPIANGEDDYGMVKRSSTLRLK